MRPQPILAPQFDADIKCFLVVDSGAGAIKVPASTWCSVGHTGFWHFTGLLTGVIFSHVNRLATTCPKSGERGIVSLQL